MRARHMYKHGTKTFQTALIVHILGRVRCRIYWVVVIYKLTCWLLQQATWSHWTWTSNMISWVNQTDSIKQGQCGDLEGKAAPYVTRIWCSISANVRQNRFSSLCRNFQQNHPGLFKRKVWGNTLCSTLEIGW